MRAVPQANAEIYQDDEGQWRWRLQAANGEIVAVGESYTRKTDARRGWEEACEAFAVASTIDGEELHERSDVDD